jgi:hypothetical protein
MDGDVIIRFLRSSSKPESEHRDRLRDRAE